MILIETRDADFADLLGGRSPEGLRLPEGAVERPEVLAMLRDLANAIRPIFTPAGWMMVDGREIVGLCSIVRQPTSEGLHIGYGVAESRRRRGYACAAINALLGWAHDDGRISTIKAETSTYNLPSQRVLEHNGFRRAGERSDEEDGDLICWSYALTRDGLSPTVFATGT